MRLLNGFQPNLDTFTYDCYLKNLVRSLPGVYPHELGQKRFLGPTSKLHRNYLCNVTWYQLSERKSSIYRDSPICPKIVQLWSTNGWEELASFCPPPKVCAQDELQAPFRFNHIRQMAPMVDANAKSLVSVNEAARRAGLRWALSCI